MRLPRAEIRESNPVPPMLAGADLHMFYQLANAPVRAFPHPHVVVENVFPADYYQALRAHLPAGEAMTSLKELGRVSEGYPDTRRVLPLTPEGLGALPESSRDFWQEVAQWMLSGAFAHLLLGKFAESLRARVGNIEGKQFYHEAMLVQDHTNFFLGPHTDQKAKAVSVLFYLPADAAQSHLGTSLYVPKDGTFRCPGDKHYRFEPFQRVYTMRYAPNTLVAFPKSDQSFHGVEPITDAGARRDLLLYDIFLEDPATVPGSQPTAANDGPTYPA
jgi:hypothetical protein